VHFAAEECYNRYMPLSYFHSLPNLGVPLALDASRRTGEGEVVDPARGLAVEENYNKFIKH